MRRPVKQPAPCTVAPPYGRDNVTGWFIYRCGKGILLVPSPRCLSAGCTGSDGRGTRNLGYAGDLGAGLDGSFRGARSAVGLRAMTGAEVGAATAELGALKDAGAIGRDYWKAATSAVERRPEQYIPVVAPGVTGSILGQPIAPWALKDVYALARPDEVGPSIREGCACTPREPDGQDPVSGWLIYRVNGGVLLTPTKKCIAGGGAIESWLSMTWRNVLTLFRTAPQTAAPAAPVTLEGPVGGAGAVAVAPEAPCVPDVIVGRDSGMFASGWWIVERNGQRLLVANPKTCP
jgi:hypothetical protein